MSSDIEADQSQQSDQSMTDPQVNNMPQTTIDIDSITEGNSSNRFSDIERGMSESSDAQDSVDFQDSSEQGNWQEVITEPERNDLLESSEVRFSEAGVESDDNHNDHGDGSHLPVDEWLEENSSETVHSTTQHSMPLRRANRFLPPDDENVYSMELRELLSR